MSDRAWTIFGAGISALSVGLSLFAPVDKWIGICGLVAGVLITVYGLVHDRLRSNRLSLVFSEEPPYTFRDSSYLYRVEFRLGIRGSRRVPKDVKVLVTNIQPMPTEYPHFREDYPYHLPQLSQKDDREILFQLGTTWISSERDLIFCGIQMDPSSGPDKLRLRPREIWDVAIQVISADAKSIEAWLMVAAVNGKLRVRRQRWKPVGL
jgi:hypothetical protein